MVFLVYHHKKSTSILYIIPNNFEPTHTQSHTHMVETHLPSLMMMSNNPTLKIIMFSKGDIFEPNNSA